MVSNRSKFDVCAGAILFYSELYPLGSLVMHGLEECDMCGEGMSLVALAIPSDLDGQTTLRQHVLIHLARLQSLLQPLVRISVSYQVLA